MKRFKALPMTLAVLSLLVVFGLATSAFARPRGYGHDRLTRFVVFVVFVFVVFEHAHMIARLSQRK